MLGFLQLIPGIGKIFDTVSSITNRLTDARIAARNADTEDKRIAAESEVDRLKLRLAALSAKMPWTVALPQFLLGMIVVIVLGKIVVWDQVLGWGFTHPLGDDVWQYIKIVTGFYFVTEWFRR